MTASKLSPSFIFKNCFNLRAKLSDNFIRNLNEAVAKLKSKTFMFKSSEGDKHNSNKSSQKSNSIGSLILDNFSNNSAFV